MDHGDSRFQVLTESTTVGIVQADLDFSIIYANLTMKSWMEVESESQLRQRPIIEYFTPESIKKIREEVKQRSHGLSSVYEVELVSNSGRRRTLVISGSPVMDATGHLVGLIATFMDVSDYKKALLLLEKTVEAMPDGVMVVDHEGKILAFNQRFVAIWEVPLGLMEKGNHDLLLNHVQTRLVNPEKFMAKREALFSSPATDFEENQFQLINGRTVEIFRRTEQFMDNTHARVICVRDVTDRLKMEARLKLADRMATIGTMAAGVAHEINNPLTHLIGGLELMAEKISGAQTLSAQELANMQSRLQVLINSSVRISSIVRDLKTFSRPDVEKAEPVDLRTVIESTISLLSVELSQKATLHLDFGKPPLVMANEGRLGQVIMNLIINAMQAAQSDNPQTNKISITTGTSAGGQVFVEVKDNGVGIPPEVQAQVFQPFFTTKSTGVGTGLGLSICYNIIKSFKGDISMQSSVGQGTLFRVTLPEAANAKSVVAPVTTGGTVRRGRIFVIDDEQDICELVVGALSEDHEVVCCYNGAEALEILRLNPLRFDLILCDLTMLVVSGLDIFESVRRESPGAESRFLFITGGALSREAEHKLHIRPHQVLAKPFNLRELRDAVAVRIK